MMSDEEIRALLAEFPEVNNAVAPVATPTPTDAPLVSPIPRIRLTVISEETVENAEETFRILTDDVNPEDTEDTEELEEEEEEELEERPREPFESNFLDLEEMPEPAITVAEEDTHEEQIIPKNSESYKVAEHTSRFSDAIWFDKIKEKVITLAGVGGIGSYVAFLLSRVHPKAVYIYDNDTVEASNLSGQLYSFSNIGTKKVNAISNMVAEYSDYQSIFAVDSLYTEESEASDIMICGFDSMSAREMYYRKWTSHVESKPDEEKKNCLFIDGRLAAESLQVFCIVGNDYESRHTYEIKWLFNDYQADETQCSYKQTTFCANMIGSIMVNLFVNFCANECNPLMPRDLPFFTSYDADTMYFKTKN